MEQAEISLYADPEGGAVRSVKPSLRLGPVTLEVKCVHTAVRFGGDS